jgi:hypothetical protein
MLKTLRRSLAFAAAFVVAVTLGSCSRKSQLADVALPELSRVSTEGRFALIMDPYVSLRDIPGSGGVTVAHARRGDVREITGRRIVTQDAQRHIWLDVGQGWVQASSVEVYSNRARAEHASSLMGLQK